MQNYKSIEDRIPRNTSHLHQIPWSDSDLKPVFWSAHIDNTCVKARKQLGLLYHHFHPAGRKALSTVLPVRLLHVPVCGTHIKLPRFNNWRDAVQRFATKLASGLWSSGCQDPIQLINCPPWYTPKKDRSYCYVDASS